MKTIKVPVAKIRIPTVRVTAVYDPELREILRSTVAKLGILTPIICTKVGEDYLLVDGLHRVEEARALGQTEVDAVVYAGDSGENLIMNLVLSKVRGKARASEMVSVIEELTKTHGLDSDQIGARTGLSREYIEKLWKISEAAPGVREALDAEIIGVGVAYEISRLPMPDQQEQMCAMQGVWRMSIAQVHDYVNGIFKLMAAAPPEAPKTQLPPPPKPRCDCCRQDVDMKDLRAVAMCPVCYMTAWNKAREVAAASQQPAEPPP